MRTLKADYERSVGELVFLSYARADKKRVFELGLVQGLARQGFRVLIDQGDAWDWDEETRPWVETFKSRQSPKRRLEAYRARIAVFLEKRRLSLHPRKTFAV